MSDEAKNPFARCLSIFCGIAGACRRTRRLQTLFQNATAGTVMPACTLSTLASNGDTVQFTMKSVQVKSVAAQVSSASVTAPAASFVNAVLGYASVTVVDTGGGTDDGGASPTGGYDLGQNTKV